MDLTITKGNVQDIDVAVNSTSVTVQQANSVLVEVTPQQRIEIQIDRAVTSNGIPAGGLTGQVLSKASDESYDAEWITLEGGGDVIGANSSVNNNLVSFNGTTGKIIKDSGYSVSSFATSAQGILADTAVQPQDLSNVAFSGDYDDLIDKPTLGTIASQNANNVSITGGSIAGITDLAIADGGTGASTASGARANLQAAQSGANTDITSLGGITGGIQTADFLQLDTAAATAIALGKLRWNPDTATAAFGIVDGTDEVNIGEQMFAFVINAESFAITRGQPVYLYQASGNRATVKLASNLGDATSAKTLGLVAQDSIGANQTGFVITQGVVSKINTSSFSEGATLYLGETAGTLTATKPKAPNHLVYIGVVERANAGNGQIYVRPQNGYELDEIHDVQINSPVNGQTIIYDQSTSLWKNANLTAGTGISVTNGASSITLTNTAPDQIVSLTAGTNVNITGTYPSFTISATGGGGGSGTVTSVALSLPSEFNISGSPVTTSGTLTGAWNNQTANYIFAAPNGSSGVPTFRSLVSADIPALSYVSSVSGSGVISSSGGLTPTISISQAGASTSGFLSSTDWNTFNSKGSGTVTSVAATAGTGISVTGSPITTSGTLNITNTAPDQTVVLNNGTGINTTGTYPNFTITNTAPDQTVSLTAGTGINVTGTYPAFTIAATASSADIQEFTTTGTATWTKPAGAKFVYVLCQGGGGGGGSGHKQLASPTQPNQGGQGGGGGGWMDAIIPAALLGSTETVTVATGGTGGASKTTSGNGVDGTTGGNSSFGSWCIGRGGNGGTGGQTATQGSGSVAQNPANNILIQQQSSGASTTVFSGAGGGRTAGTAGGSGSNGGKNAGGGGGGGGLANPATAALAGGNGGSGGAGVIASTNTLAGSGGAGGTAGGNGTAGANATNDYLGAAGGGGGSSSTTADGGSGGNGGYPAGGGGGGGSCLSSFNSGAGGNGGNGYVLVITIF